MDRKQAATENLKLCKNLAGSVLDHKSEPVKSLLVASFLLLQPYTKIAVMPAITIEDGRNIDRVVLNLKQQGIDAYAQARLGSGLVFVPMREAKAARINLEKLARQNKIALVTLPVHATKHHVAANVIHSLVGSWVGDNWDPDSKLAKIGVPYSGPKLDLEIFSNRECKLNGFAAHWDFYNGKLIVFAPKYGEWPVLSFKEETFYGRGFLVYEGGETLLRKSG